MCISPGGSNSLEPTIFVNWIYSAPNSHQPFDLIWVIENPETDYLACAKGPLDTSWFPDLTFSLFWLADNSWPDIQPTLCESYPKCIWETFYIRPGGRTATCGDPKQFYCTACGCETSREQGVEGVKDRPYQDCPAGRQLQILRITCKTKQAIGWEAEKSWSLQLPIAAGSKPGLPFTIILLIKPIVNPLLAIVGPNQVLTNPKPI